MDFARVSLGMCKGATLSSAGILQGVRLEVAVVLLGLCKDAVRISLGVLQGFCKGFPWIVQ